MQYKLLEILQKSSWTRVRLFLKSKAQSNTKEQEEERLFIAIADLKIYFYHNFRILWVNFQKS